jgi:hypothetical protein
MINITIIKIFAKEGGSAGEQHTIISLTAYS